jgi:hypothetical protein
VVDRSTVKGINVLPIDYITAVYTVEKTTTKSNVPLQKLDIVTEKDGDKVIVKAFLDGKPTPEGTKLRVFNPENWEKEVVVDENGEAIFYPTIKGTYIIRQDYTEKQPGNYKDVSYQNIRHRCNYFLWW